MAAKKTVSILGKIAKEWQENKWSVVPGTTQKLNKKYFDDTTIVVHQSTYKDKELYATVKVGKHYVNFTVDINVRAQDGDHLDPTTVKVYDLTDGDNTITRLWGKVL